MAILYSGTEGTCQWTIDDQGHLYIGSGVISHNTTSYSDWSWYSYTNEITSVSSGNVSWAVGANAYAMFQNCYQVMTQAFDLSNFDTSNVTDMTYMFCNCRNVKSFNLSSFDTSNVTDMSEMFLACSNLTEIIVSNLWNVNNVVNSNAMFEGCMLLCGGAGTTYNSSYMDKTYAHIDGGVSNPGYLTDINSVPCYASFDSSNGELKIFRDVSGKYTNNQVIGTKTYWTGIENLTGKTPPKWIDKAEEGEILSICIINKFKPKTAYQMFSDCYHISSLDLSNLDTSDITDMSYMFYSCEQLTSLDLSNFDTSNVTDTSLMFFYCTSLISLDLLNFDTSNVTSMGGMFGCCYSLTSLDLSNFNTSNVTDMSNMFGYCQSLTSLDLSNFNTSNVINMAEMFFSCIFLTTLDLSNFDTSKVTDMNYMFRGCNSLTSLDLSIFNTSNVTNMDYMFGSCNSLTSLDLSNFNTSNVTNMAFMFDGCLRLASLNLTGFNTSKITDMKCMFDNCNSLASLDLSSFNTSQVNDMSYMFYGCESLISLDLSNFNTSKVTNMSYMFDDCNSLISLDLSNFDTSNVTNISYMFYDCNSLSSLNLFNFNTSKVTNMSYMFRKCTQLITIIVSDLWDVNQVTTSIYMFTDCTALVGEQNTIYDSSHTDKTYACVDGGQSNPGYLTHINSVPCYASFNSSNGELKIFRDISGKYTNNQVIGTKTYWTGIEDITGNTNPKWYDIRANIQSIRILNKFSPKTAYRMFYDCLLLTSLNLSNLDTSNATNMSGMFDSCRNLTSLNLSNFDTSQVTSMYHMFYGCLLLTSLNLSNFNTSNVTDMSGMFIYCQSLTSLNLSNFDTNNVTSMHDMFAYCYLLTSLDLLNFETSNITDMRHMFYNCRALTKLNLTTFNTSNVTDMEKMFANDEALTKIYVSDKWTTSIVTNSTDMFTGCALLVGENNTTYDSSHVDKTYAHVDGGASNPGYLTGEMTLHCYASFNADNKELRIFRDELYKYDVGGTGETRGNITYWSGIENITGETGPKWASQDNPIDIHAIKIVNKFKPKTGFGLFAGCNVTLLDVSNLDTSEITNMYGMFANCKLLTSLDLSSFNTSNVTNMGWMFMFDEALTSVNISNFNTSNVTSMTWMFAGCKLLNNLDVSNFDTSNVTDMWYMFMQCLSLASLDVTNFDTSNVTNMCGMFGYCSQLTTLDVSGFDTNKTTDMSYMFGECSSLASLNLSNFNTNNVINMAGMFGGCSQLISLNLSNFNTNKVTSMYRMFLHCNSLTLLDLSNFNTSNVTDMIEMFNDCCNLTSLNISSFDTSNVLNMSQMFSTCSNLTSLNISNFNTNKVRYMTKMFENCTQLISLDLSNFNTSEVINMEGMFYNCSSLTLLDLSSFDTSSVTNISGMFYQCGQLSYLDLSSFNTSNVTNMYRMFASCNSLKWIAVSNLWNTNKVTDSTDMFLTCTSLRGGAGTSYNNSSTDISMAHIDGGTSNPGYLSDFIGQLKAFAEFDSSTGQLTIFRDIYDAYTDGEEMGTKIYWADIEALAYPAEEDVPAWREVAGDITAVNIIHKIKPRSGYEMFAYCSELTSLDLSNLDTSDMISMFSMFQECSGLTSLDLSHFNTSNVTEMMAMFNGCSGLTSLDLSNFNTSNVINMQWMFLGCENLTSLNLTSFNTSKVKYMNSMFRYCSSLVSLNLSNFNTSQLSLGIDSMFENCTSLTTLNFNLSNAATFTSMEDCFRGCSALTTVPSIPPSVTNLSACFNGCSSLTGDIHTMCIPTTYNGCFTNTVEKINLIYDSPTIPTVWKTITDTYSNVYLGTIIGDYFISEVDDIYNISDETKIFSAKVVDKTKTSYQPLPRYIQIDRTDYEIYDYTSCFENCTSLVEAPVITQNALILNSCFKGCVNLQGRIPVQTWIRDGGQIVDDRFDDIFTDTIKPIKLCVIDLKTDNTCDFDDDPWKQIIDSGIYSNVSLWDVSTGVIDFLTSDYNITLLSEENGVWNITVSSTNKTSYSLTPTPENLLIPILINGIPYNQVEFNECFKGCSNITSIPDHYMSSTTTQMNECFKGCTSLIKAPPIPSNVVEMNECFSSCQSLQGNIIIYNNPTAANRIFNGTSNQIYIVNQAAPTRSIGNTADETWRIIAGLYQNVHYGYDDYIPPSVEFAAKRVATSDSEDEMVSGEYVFMQLNYTDSSPTLPDGWYTTQEIQSCTINNINQSVIWYHNNNTFKGWNPVDLYETTIAVTMAISFKDENDSLKGTIEIEVTGGLEEVYRLVDFLAGGKGVAFGKVAENEGFDNTLKTIFRNEILFEIDNNDSVWKTAEEKNLENMILNGLNSEYWL